MIFLDLAFVVIPQQLGKGKNLDSVYLQAIYHDASYNGGGINAYISTT